MENQKHVPTLFNEAMHLPTVNDEKQDLAFYAEVQNKLIPVAEKQPFGGKIKWLKGKLVCAMQLTVNFREAWSHSLIGNLNTSGGNEHRRCVPFSPLFGMGFSTRDFEQFSKFCQLP